jgi:hypothetical protein
MEKYECHGCRDDFYNTSDRECWMFKKAKIVTRYQIGTWTTPDSKKAFREVKVPNCYHCNGRAFYDTLPNFVRLEDVVRLKKV